MLLLRPPRPQFTLTVYLTTLSATSIGVLGNDLSLTVLEPEPGVRVLDGLFSASAVHPIMDFPPNPDTSDGDLLDFQQLRAMNVLVQGTRKKACINHSTFGYLSPCTAQSKAHFSDALQYTANTLWSSLEAFDAVLCQSSGDKSRPVNSPLTNNFSQRVPLQSHCPKQASEEMVKVGLVESSCLLHPFNQPDDTDYQDVPSSPLNIQA